MTVSDTPKAKYATGEETVARLRDLATAYARSLAHAEKTAKKPREAYAKLVAVCSAIEVVTQDGNYYPELLAAKLRAQEFKS